MTNDLATFLRARYTEETKRAQGSRKIRRIEGRPCPRCHQTVAGFGSAWAGGAIRINHESDHSDIVDGCELTEDEWHAFADDGISDDGARRLADLESKRRAVDLCVYQAQWNSDHDPDVTDHEITSMRMAAHEHLRILALPYTGHPEYKEMRRP